MHLNVGLEATVAAGGSSSDMVASAMVKSPSGKPELQTDQIVQVNQTFGADPCSRLPFANMTTTWATDANGSCQ